MTDRDGNPDRTQTAGARAYSSGKSPASWKSRAPRLNRQWHRFGSIVAAAPLLVVIVTGLLLQLKKEWSWVQPPTMRGSTTELSLPWDKVLEAAASVPEAEIRTWDDIDRHDVRPSCGMHKVQSKNSWEVQIDTTTGEVLLSTYRRSDLIESLHDGSWFTSWSKLWIFLPAVVILLGLWFTGMYLWALPHMVKRRRKH